MQQSQVENSAATVYRTIRDNIALGQWQDGQQLPSETELAQQFGVCRSTINKSLRQLQRDGLLRSHRGKGHFVTAPGGRARVGALGVLLFDINHLVLPVTGRFLTGVKEVLSDEKLHVKVSALNLSVADLAALSEARWRRLVDVSSVDGIVVWAQQTPLDLVQELAVHVPLVWVHQQTIAPNIAGVGVDVVGASFAAARHLLELGHRRIALVAGPEGFSTTKARQDGLRLALRQLPSEESLRNWTCFCSDHQATEEAARWARTVLQETDRPTAFITASDELAQGVYQAAMALGLRVPEDVSVIGNGDAANPAAVLPIKLTRTITDFGVLGARAARRLVEMIEQRGRLFPTVEIESSLLVGNSTASPPSDS